MLDEALVDVQHAHGVRALEIGQPLLERAHRGIDVFGRTLYLHERRLQRRARRVLRVRLVRGGRWQEVPYARVRMCVLQLLRERAARPEQMAYEPRGHVQLALHLTVGLERVNTEPEE